MTPAAKLIRYALIAVLGWQALHASWDLVEGALGRHGRFGYGARLSISADERVAMWFGKDAELATDLRRELPPEAIVLVRPLVDIDESRLIQSLRHVLYPAIVFEVDDATVINPPLHLSDRPILLLDLDHATRNGAPPSDAWTGARAVGAFILYDSVRD